MILRILILTFSIVTVFASYGFSAEDITAVEIAILQEKYAQAQALAERLSQHKNDKSTTQQLTYYLALSRLKQGQDAEARELFKKILEEDKRSDIRERAYLGICDSYYSQGEYQEAVEVLEGALAADVFLDYLSLVYLKLAKAHLKLAHWQKAKDYLQRIAQEYPLSLETHSAKQLLAEQRYFAVQVGSFLDRQKAQELMNELRQKEEYAYIVETKDEHNRAFYRVRVGQLAVLEDANQLKSKLAAQGYPTQIYP